MLIKILGDYVEHKAVVHVGVIDRKYEGDHKTTYKVEVSYVVGESYHTLIEKYDNYRTRDKELEKIVADINAQYTSVY